MRHLRLSVLEAVVRRHLHLWRINLSVDYYYLLVGLIEGFLQVGDYYVVTTGVE